LWERKGQRCLEKINPVLGGRLRDGGANAIFRGPKKEIIRSAKTKENITLKSLWKRAGQLDENIIKGYTPPPLKITRGSLTEKTE